jgi:methylated-DNA-[protein]-cysteine S-methyltransferase
MLPTLVVKAAPDLTLRLTGGDAGIRAIGFHPGAPLGGDAHPVLAEAARQLQAYFAGTLYRFDLPLDLHGTGFQVRVWRALLDVPYGETRSYRYLAENIGAPTAVRAVGAANGANPLPIVVPCHRIIGSSGALTGYGGGLPLKRRLLELEARYAWRSRQAGTV